MPAHILLAVAFTAALVACKPATPAHDAVDAAPWVARDTLEVRHAIPAEPRQPTNADVASCAGPAAEDRPGCVQNQQVQLANAFARTQEASDDPATLQQAQRRWAARRLTCRKQPDPRTCEDQTNRARIAELQQAQANAPRRVEFDCQGSDLPLTAQFRNGDRPSAILMLGGDRVEVPAVPGGSGARYAGEGVEYREHQGEASVDFHGTRLTCKPLD